MNSIMWEERGRKKPAEQPNELLLVRPGRATARRHVIPAWNLCLRSGWHRALTTEATQHSRTGAVWHSLQRSTTAAGEQKAVAGSGSIAADRIRKFTVIPQPCSILRLIRRSKLSLFFLSHRSIPIFWWTQLNGTSCKLSTVTRTQY
jgi:hypothetical protein